MKLQTITTCVKCPLAQSGEEWHPVCLADPEKPWHLPKNHDPDGPPPKACPLPVMIVRFGAPKPKPSREGPPRPLTAHTRKVLLELCFGHIRAHKVNPGVIRRLRQEGLAEVEHTHYNGVDGKWLAITEAGRARVNGGAAK